MDRINLIAGALVEICCCCLKQNFSDVAEDGEGIACFPPPSENLILIPQMTRCGGQFGGLFPHKTITNLKCHRNTIQRNNPLKIWDITENYFITLHPPQKGGGGGLFIGLLFLLWQCKMKPLAPAGSSRACIEAKINTAISEQDLSGVRFFSEVTEEQLHLSGEFNCEA